jgi:hypothetical protein
MTDILKNVEKKLKGNLDSSEKGIIGTMLSLQNTLLKGALQIEQFVSHDNPTHLDVAEAINAISNRLEEIDFPNDEIDAIVCDLQKAIAVLEEKRNTS